MKYVFGIDCPIVVEEFDTKASGIKVNNKISILALKQALANPQSQRWKGSIALFQNRKSNLFAVVQLLKWSPPPLERACLSNILCFEAHQSGSASNTPIVASTARATSVETQRQMIGLWAVLGFPVLPVERWLACQVAVELLTAD